MFFAWQLLCAPRSQPSCEEPRLAASDDPSEGSLASRHRAPPEDICRYSAQHEQVQREEHRFREAGWEANLINNESVTWCTDRGWWLLNGSIQYIVYSHGRTATEGNSSGQQPHQQQYSIMIMMKSRAWQVQLHGLKSLMRITFPVSDGAWSLISRLPE